MRRRRAVRPAGPGGGRAASFSELRAGAPVVHEDHGIALFTGFETKTVGGVTRDYLELEFLDGDRVFVPSDELHKVSRYVGADAGDPRFEARRQAVGTEKRAPGTRPSRSRASSSSSTPSASAGRPAFPRDGKWQLEFEDSFPYRETPDQLDAIEAVSADMEAARPMDRLICGDVGFGKTEVALRAAFKAAAAVQVVFLAPTTVLAEQHWAPSRERMRDYPFRIEVAFALRSPAEVRETPADLPTARWTS